MKRRIEIINPMAGGVDVGSKNFYVDAGEEDIRIFSTYTEGCNQVRDYFLELKVKTVAMEVTGVYWVNLYDILEQAGM